MRRAGNEMEALIDGLRGRPVSGVDWKSVIAFANHTLLTPALYDSLVQSGQIDRVPQDVSEYLRFIHDCNRDRNLRLRSQLIEAVTAFNERGIVPLLIKGAVPIFLAPGDQVPSRMTSDLDICVEEGEMAEARACLKELGYLDVLELRGMARPEDAGVLELRASRADGYEPPKVVEKNGHRVTIPPVLSRARNWITHDLIKEGDYWRGRIDLRHLHDLAQLAEREGLDWTALRASMPGQTGRNALDTQLRALNRFFGIGIPAEWIERPLIRFQHWRRIFTARHPVIGAPLRLAGNLAWGVRRLLQSPELVRRGPTDLARRVTRKVLNRDIRSKI